MLFYNSVGPNPRVVRMFMAERGIKVPQTEIDLRGGENRRAPYMARNPTGQMPALELDDGTVLAEITALCEYLDESNPGASLIGTNALERAETRMWVRRCDLGIVEPMANGYRFSQGLKLFENRIRCIPQAADDLKKTAAEKLAWLDGQLAGKQWICGERFSLADIFVFCFVDFGNQVGQPLDPGLKNIGGWFERMKARPSAAA
jgi:glutathione S-transferase